MPKYATPEEAFNGKYTLSEVIAFCGLTRGEAEQWMKRGIISAQSQTGRGNHREFTFWNLVEASLAKRLSAGFKMQTIQVESIIQGVRDRLKDHGIGMMGFTYERLFMGDWTFSIIIIDGVLDVRLQYGGLGENNFFPLAATVNIGMAAQELLDVILEDDSNGRKGSQNWCGQAFYLRRARNIGAIDESIPPEMFPITREEPDHNHPGSFNNVETLAIMKPNNKPISEEKWTIIKNFIRDQLNRED